MAWERAEKGVKEEAFCGEANGSLTILLSFSIEILSYVLRLGPCSDDTTDVEGVSERGLETVWRLCTCVFALSDEGADVDRSAIPMLLLSVRAVLSAALPLTA